MPTSSGLSSCVISRPLAVQSLASNLLFEELLVEEIERLIGRPVKRGTETLSELCAGYPRLGNVIPFPGTRSILGESPVKFEEIAKKLTIRAAHCVVMAIAENMLSAI